jgi:hypothetical protein
MKALLVLALCAIAFAADPQTVAGRFGYDTEEFSHPKSDGWAFVTATITDAMLAPFRTGNGTALTGSFQIEIYAYTTSTSSRTANTAIYFKTGSAPTSKTDEKLVTKTVPSDDMTGLRIITTELQAVSSSQSLVIYFGFNGDCSGCVSSADYKANIFLRWDSAGGSNFNRVPFAVIDNPYTFDYSLNENTNGLAAYLDVTADTQVYIKVSMQTTSSGSAVVVIFTKDAPFTGTTTPTDQSITKFRPDEACPPCRTGSYTTSAVTLTGPVAPATTVRWFITPRVGKVAVSGTKAGFDFAVGVGHLPASGAMLVPSIISVALAALAALFLL